MVFRGFFQVKKEPQKGTIAYNQKGCPKPQNLKKLNKINTYCIFSTFESSLQA